MTKIRNRYNQEPQLTQDTKWESDNSKINITHRSQEVSPFPTGDHKAAMNRHERMTDTSHINTKRSTALERSVKYFTGGFKPVLRRQPRP